MAPQAVAQVETYTVATASVHLGPYVTKHRTANPVGTVYDKASFDSFFDGLIKADKGRPKLAASRTSAGKDATVEVLGSPAPATTAGTYAPAPTAAYAATPVQADTEFAD